MRISPAAMKDSDQLVTLVNSGYRGEASKKGWTTEADLLEGDLRIDKPTLESMLNEPNAVLLKAASENGDIAGCVYLQKQERGLYLGLLTVSPDLQAAGIGRQLLAASENFARENNCRSVYMTVISRRVELINWYVRNGYRLTDETKPFPTDQKFGTPTMPLEFVILEKVL